MRKLTVLSMFFVILALVTTVAWAGGTSVQLPDGAITNVLIPGVDGVSHPRLIRSSMELPAWPETARAEKGKVLLAVLVLKDGTAADAMVVDATHVDAGFQEVAVAAAHNWHFRPAMLKRDPVDSYIFLEVAFRNERKTSAHPVWPSSFLDRSLLQYGGISSTSSVGTSQSQGYTKSQSMTIGGVTSGGHGFKSPNAASGNMTLDHTPGSFEGLVKAINVDWVFYAGGLIDMRPPSQRPVPTYP